MLTELQLLLSLVNCLLSLERLSFQSVKRPNMLDSSKKEQRLSTLQCKIVLTMRAGWKVQPSSLCGSFSEERTQVLNRRMQGSASDLAITEARHMDLG